MRTVLYSESPTRTLSSISLPVINGSPVDIEDFLRYAPVDPSINRRRNFFTALRSSGYSSLLEKMVSTPDFGQYYANLSDADKLSFLPSRYCQSYAELDTYASFIRDELAQYQSFVSGASETSTPSKD